MGEEKKCARCARGFAPTAPHQVYCSSGCRKRAYLEIWQEAYCYPEARIELNLSKGSGACARCRRGPKSPRSARLCEKCLKEETQRQREQRKARQSSGLCIVCSKPREHYRHFCDGCALKQRVQARERRVLMSREVSGIGRPPYVKDADE